MRPILRELYIEDNIAAWQAVGFDVVDSVTRIGTTALVFTGQGACSGLVGWSLDGVPAGDIDGIPTSEVPAIAHGGEPPTHPNGSVSIDHVVVVTPDLARTIEALAVSGFDLRRTRDVSSTSEPRRQAFYRMGETILEVVGPTTPTGDEAASLWGFVTVVDDLQRTGLARFLGETRNAVQPDRQIATVRREAGLAVPLAFLTPHPT